MEWIKTTDRLPPFANRSGHVQSSDKVLVWYTVNNRSGPGIGTYINGSDNYWLVRGASDDCVVTHWAEITPPVEGE